ncbi:two component transcriptional regulator, LuxR family [Shewanella sp. MR-4]|uniref:two-component system response regulator NarL n=1 Tax=Shewanella sp. (strain MR-4) TaxID=60480 RepID=UPI00005E5684|nr:two-component system response regulator NarL [Shewanella sp. MR-4]ABI39296.1 two component transcriptional regulator, LuxR family [Shewanella sp. MR-4]
MCNQVITEEDKATILLIDDHPMLRNGVKQLIGMADNLCIVAEASCGKDGIILATQLDPDLILLDLNMPEFNGLETLTKLRECELSSRIIVFTVSNYEGDIVNAFKYGADGYLLKDMEPEDLLQSIQQAAAGKIVLSDAIAPILATGLRHNPPATKRDIESLTAREKDIIRLVSQGLSNKMIARKLIITEGTVKVHVKNLLKKLSFKSRVEATVWILQENIF